MSRKEKGAPFYPQQSNYGEDSDHTRTPNTPTKQTYCYALYANYLYLKSMSASSIKPINSEIQ